jgi:hypothetical protein
VYTFFCIICILLSSVPTTSPLPLFPTLPSLSLAGLVLVPPSCSLIL